MTRKKKYLLTVMLCTAFAFMLSGACLAFTQASPALAEGIEGEYNLVEVSSQSDWLHPYENQGTFTADAEAGTIAMDSVGAAFGMEGAVYVSAKGNPLGAYEVSANIRVTRFDTSNQIGWAGLVPWYIDDDNYLSVQMKFTTIDAKDGTGTYIKSQEEIDQGFAIEQILVTGRLNGEDKYVTLDTREANTSYMATETTELGKNKLDVLNENGHNIRLTFENSGASALNYRMNVYYNGVLAGNTELYYYPAVVRPLAIGVMGQDVEAVISDFIVNDYYASALRDTAARDWKERNGFIYRILNGVETYTFEADGGVTVDASQYGITGTNFAAHNTSRGFTPNPVAVTNDGLPQNYEVKAAFGGSDIPSSYGDKSGFGLIPWYKDDNNYVTVTLRSEIKGSRTDPEPVYTLVLHGWIAASNLPVGTNEYTLPADFDMTAEHTIRVEKKSVEFLVYLDDGAEPVIRKKVLGSGENYSYGYEGYNCTFTASALESRAIYDAYDEISMYDGEKNVWKASGKTENSWVFASSEIFLSAAETGSALASESYLTGASDISAANIELRITAYFTGGSEEQLSSLMIVPYLYDDDNYVHIGLVWKNGKTYARVRASVYTESDRLADEESDQPLGPVRVYKEIEIDAISRDAEMQITVQKVGCAVVLSVNGKTVYGVRIEGIEEVTPEYGFRAYNGDLTISSYETVGYKRYENISVGDWTTSGVSRDAWVSNESGYMIGNNLYAESDPVVDDDEGRIFAVKENPAELQQDYTVTASVRLLETSRAQDRIGIMCWYIDENNFLVYMLDRWRADSYVARTTFFGKIGGNFLAQRYTHGGWLPQGSDAEVQQSQLTNLHTLTVVKTGNTFYCYVDNGAGAITMTVELPALAADQKVYAGLYVLNDKVEFTEYGVYENGGSRVVSTPCPVGQALGPETEREPSIAAYDAVDFIDEFDGLTSTAVRSVEPNEPNDEENPDGSNDGEDTKKSSGGCNAAFGAGSLAAAGIAAAAAALAAIGKKKRR